MDQFVAGTGYVATQNLPESEDEEDETDEIQAGKAEPACRIFHLGVKLSGVTCFGDVWGCLTVFLAVAG